MMAFLGLREDLDQRRAVQIFQHRRHRQAADEFRNEAELDEVDRLHVRQQVDIAAAADARTADPVLSSSCRKPMDFLPVRRAITFSRPTKAPPQMNRMLVVSTGVNSWCGCLRPPCGGTLATVPSRIFSSACCTPSPGDIAGDGRILVLAADLVDFVDIDDALLALLHIAVGRLEQLQDDVLHIFAHVAGFGEGGGVHNGEWHVQDLGQGLRQQRLAGAGGPDQQDIGLLQLHLAVAHAVHVDALAVVVDRHRQLLLGGILPDHVLIQKLLHFQRLRDLVGGSRGRLDLVVF